MILFSQENYLTLNEKIVLVQEVGEVFTFTAQDA